MKDATIADAHAVMRRATTGEGLSMPAAISKYHDELDLVSRQYALLPTDAQPVCLAAGPHRSGAQHPSVLSQVTDRFVDMFAAIADRLTLNEISGADTPDPQERATGDGVFFVPDMNCEHCVRTITGVLESMQITVHEIDLISKRVVAEFRSPRNRNTAFEALRDGGYNPTLAAQGEDRSGDSNTLR